MRVLLISANTEHIGMPVLPLGLACVAAAADRQGHAVKTLNLMLQGDVQQALRSAIVESNPEIIGISVRNIDDQNMAQPRFLLDAAKDVVDACRSLTRAAIVLGGAGISIFPQASLDFLGADISVQGEGERTFLGILENVGNKKALARMPGVYLPGGSRRNPPECINALADMPLPLPGLHLATPSVDKDQPIWVPLQSRRGCPMDCSYCSTASIEGRIIRKNDPRKVAAAIARYVEAGLDHFFFVDNTFNLPNSYAEALCDHLIASGLKISWRCILYPWKVGEDLVEKMAKAGCREVSLGFESGSEKILAAMNKKCRPSDIRCISERLQRHGIAAMGFLLFGGPGETRQTVRESLEYADSLPLVAMKVTIGIRIYPHTALARTAVREGVIDARDTLLVPRFYMAKGLEGWLRETVDGWRKKRPHWVM